MNLSEPYPSTYDTPYRVRALRLASHHLLTGEAERELLARLPFDAQCGDEADLVRFLYTTKLKKYAPVSAELNVPKELARNDEVRVAAAERADGVRRDLHAREEGRVPVLLPLSPPWPHARVRGYR